MNPIKSIQARYQGYCAKNFEKTKYGKQIASFKNAHEGESCFVIGNGPSLTVEDLDVLYKNNMASFASNNILKLFEKTQWRPKYYVCEDILVLKDIEQKISSADLENKFIPINYHWFDDINIDKAKYFYQSFSPDVVFSYNAAKSVVCKGTVTTTCIQLAAFMGYKNIYLLGVDHNYSKTVDNAGNITVDNSVKDYFDDEYAKTMEKKMIPNLEATTRAYEQVKECCDKIGVNVFNATRGGKLEVYPRADFDKLF